MNANSRNRWLASRLGALLLLATLSAMAQAQQTTQSGDVEINMTEFKVPTAGASSRNTFVSRRDGYTWYASQKENLLGRFDTKTQKSEVYHLRPGSDPYSIVEHSGSGVQSTVYFTSRTGGMIGEFDANTRDVREFKIPGAKMLLNDLGFDRNGVLWFTVDKSQAGYPQGSEIGSINLFSSEIKLAQTPTRNTTPGSIAVNSKGTPFFVETGAPKLGSIDPVTMKITEHTLPNPKSDARGLAITPDDAVWYTDEARGFLGRFDVATGKADEWPSPGGADSRPGAIAIVRKVLWYVEAGPGPKLVRFDPATKKFQSWPLTAGGVEQLYAHPDGSLWFSIPSTNTMVRVTVKETK